MNITATQITDIFCSLCSAVAVHRSKMFDAIAEGNATMAEYRATELVSALRARAHVAPENPEMAFPFTEAERAAIREEYHATR